MGFLVSLPVLEVRIFRYFSLLLFWECKELYECLLFTIYTAARSENTESNQ